MSKFPDITRLYADSDKMLWLTQEQYEDTIKLKVKAREAWLNAKMAYEKVYLDAMERCKIKGEPVTLTKEKAQRECFALYEQMCILENEKKRFDSFIGLYSERINTIKAILKTKIEG